MPIYEYHCLDNDLYVEVLHGINEKVQTWGNCVALPNGLWAIHRQKRRSPG